MKTSHLTPTRCGRCNRLGVVGDLARVRRKAARTACGNPEARACPRCAYIAPVAAFTVKGRTIR